MSRLPRGLRFGISVLTLALAAGFYGCANPASPASIHTGPSFAVRYATERISPAVVQLDVVTENFSNGQSVPDRSIGSGFIIDKQGHILTNFHVAGRAKRIDVTLADQEHVKGKLLGSDHWTDLALVQMDMDEVHRKGLTFQTATLGDSSEVALGEPVMAVGTPYGLSRTVTSGIVSNTDRSFDEMTMEGGYETGWFNNWIQTDAAINPGNSGGPLINLRGEVIGINTRGISSGNNLGFAIPINVARNVVKDLLAHEKVTRSYIGVELQPLQDLEKHYDLAVNRGVLIRNVDDNSPAKAAGVQAEDILLAVDGTPVNARFPEQLAPVRKLISNYPIGSKLELTLQRNPEGGAAVITASALPTSGENAKSSTTAPAGGTQSAPAPKIEALTLAVTTDKLESAITEEESVSAWGMTVRDLTRTYFRDHRIPYTKGVLVTGTRVGSPADRADLRGGDIILRVDDKPVSSVDELQAAVAKWKKNPPAVVGVDVARDRGQYTLALKP